MRQSTQLFFALAAAVIATPLPQAVTSAVAPDSLAPTGCAASYTGTFGMAIGTISASATPTATSTPAKRLLARRASSELDFLNSAPQPVARATGDIPVACATNGTLEMTLSDGVMKDIQGRTASIVANRQFQFDDPPQAGAVYTAGWSVCDDGAIALGGSKTFYQCLSGTFYNLYDSNIGDQCQAIQMQVIRLQDCGANGTSTTSA